MTLSTMALAIQLLTAVESGGNPRTFNAREDAAGILQIRPIMVAEVNRILEKHKVSLRFTNADRYDPEKSREMARIYFSEFATEKYLGRIPTIEDYALLWCAGPRGPFKARTDSMIQYVAKVNRLAPSTMVAGGPRRMSKEG